MREELIRIANRVVDLAIESDIECEAFVQKKRYNSITVEGGKITFGSQDGDYGIGIRIIEKHRTGFAYCTEKTIPFGLKQALQVARFSKPGKYEFHDNTDYKGTRSIYDNKIATLVSEEGINLAQDIIDGASFDKRVLPSRGGMSFGVMSYAIANSKGVSVYDEGTVIGGYMMSVLKDGDVVTNGDESMASRELDFNFEEIGHTATERAIAQLGQKPIETATMTVIMKPDAAYDILANTVIPALYGGAVKKNESVYAEKMGEKVASESIDIVDDATHLKGLNTFVMDEEGYPSRRNVLVEDGILNSFLYDSFTAIECDAKPTGNAMHADRFTSGTTYKVAPSTCARNFILEGETMPEEEMIRDIKHGIIVENVLGAHTANKASGDFSVAIYSGYMIKDGDIAYPIKGGMIGGNMPNMLLNAFLADNYRVVESGVSPASGYIPSIKFENVKVSG
ncbi:TldD/PmbA family protein [Methanocella sp. CWC-04]|uniref:TldD/PmbA family protein n=1 Tax=Methanooceanicella nereidis TaxID=2052831 RepID=A0AAP2RE44_9EURY|nr:TldD/PmbA family protein [Methanocella sp. CWC-04]MCD1295668.1 TldD/PmbA family protein [Methanocella sp. CWC-04]